MTLVLPTWLATAVVAVVAGSAAVAAAVVDGVDTVEVTVVVTVVATLAATTPPLVVTAGKHFQHCVRRCYSQDTTHWCPCNASQRNTDRTGLAFHFLH